MSLRRISRTQQIKPSPLSVLPTAITLSVWRVSEARGMQTDGSACGLESLGITKRADGRTAVHMYRVCQKVTAFWYLSFLPLLDALFAIFVYLHIIFIKCLISEPSVVSIQMDSPAGWCTIAHCEKHDKLPQKGECFIHRASDVASKQP